MIMSEQCSTVNRVVYEPTGQVRGSQLGFALAVADAGWYIHTYT